MRKTTQERRRERLGELIHDRRIELGLTKAQLAANAGLGRGGNPSGRSVYNLERGTVTPNDLTASGIERALGWERKSIRRYIETGKEPGIVPVRTLVEQTEENHRFVYRTLADADEETFAKIRAVLEGDVPQN